MPQRSTASCCCGPGPPRTCSRDASYRSPTVIARSRWKILLVRLRSPGPARPPVRRAIGVITHVQDLPPGTGNNRWGSDKMHRREQVRGGPGPHAQEPYSSAACSRILPQRSPRPLRRRWLDALSSVHPLARSPSSPNGKRVVYGNVVTGKRGGGRGRGVGTLDSPCERRLRRGARLTALPRVSVRRAQCCLVARRDAGRVRHDRCHEQTQIAVATASDRNVKIINERPWPAGHAPLVFRRQSHRLSLLRG